jgi:hypothetical protein
MAILYICFIAVQGNHSSIALDSMAIISILIGTRNVAKAPEFDYECQGMEDPRIVK